MPTKGTAGAAGFDLHAWIPESTDWVQTLTGTWAPGTRIPVAIRPGERAVIKTGLNVRVPENMELQIRPRSGLAFKKGITVLNSPGTVDSDYDGDGESFEIGVIVVNHGNDIFEVNHGDRIAQGVFCDLPDVELVEDFEDNTHRNESNRAGGFGHTGV